MPDAVEEYFDGKPASLSIFRAIADVIDGYGTSAMTVGSQISFGRERKFAWFWLYNATKKNPDGVPHLMLAIDHGVDSEHVRNVEQIGESRWNHQIVVRTLGDARSPGLAKLVGLAHDYGGG